MRHRATPRFWACYRQLPAEVQSLANRCYRALKADPQHPSLQFKKIGSRFYSVRVGLHYRALSIPYESGYVWFWIGTHAEYDALIRRL